MAPDNKRYDDQALVTIITPTLQRRHEKLTRAILSVDAQTFPHWHHMVIGNDDIGWDDDFRKRSIINLGQPHPTPGHWNRVLGGLLATTPYIAYLDDDNTWAPDHLARCVEMLETVPGIGFTHGQMDYPDGHTLECGDLSLSGAVNHIDASMIVHRTELLRNVATWDPHTAPEGLSYAMDGVLVQKWIDAGVTYMPVNAVTVHYSGVGYWLDGGGAGA